MSNTYCASDCNEQAVDFRGGETWILHDPSSDRIASLVGNTARGRSLRQQTGIALVLPQLRDFQARPPARRTGHARGQAIGEALAELAR